MSRAATEVVSDEQRVAVKAWQALESFSHRFFERRLNVAAAHEPWAADVFDVGLRLLRAFSGRELAAGEKARLSITPYSAVDGDLVRVDPTNGKITITLPLALPVTRRVFDAVKAWRELSKKQRGYVEDVLVDARRRWTSIDSENGEADAALAVLRELAVDGGAK